MAKTTDTQALGEKLKLELRRGTLVLAVLSRLDSARYGYSLVQGLGELGLTVEQGTLYPLLRRLDEQGLLESRWDVDGSRPRKYYSLTETGVEVLRDLTREWRELVEVMTRLLTDTGGENTDASD